MREICADLTINKCLSIIDLDLRNQGQSDNRKLRCHLHIIINYFAKYEQNMSNIFRT